MEDFGEPEEDLGEVLAAAVFEEDAGDGVEGGAGELIVGHPGDVLEEHLEHRQVGLDWRADQQISRRACLAARRMAALHLVAVLQHDSSPRLAMHHGAKHSLGPLC